MATALHIHIDERKKPCERLISSRPYIQSPGLHTKPGCMIYQQTRRLSALAKYNTYFAAPSFALMASLMALLSALPAVLAMTSFMTAPICLADVAPADTARH